MLLCITCSRTLHVIDSRDTGRWFPCKLLSPFIYMGTFHVFLHSSGTIPVSRDRWKIKALIGASFFAASLSIKAGMESGPVDLRFLSSL